MGRSCSLKASEGWLYLQELQVWARLVEFGNVVEFLKSHG